MTKASKPFFDGFFGSFRLALTIVVMVASMVCAFFQAGAHAAINVAREFVHR